MKPAITFLLCLMLVGCTSPKPHASRPAPVTIMPPSPFAAVNLESREQKTETSSSADTAAIVLPHPVPQLDLPLIMLSPVPLTNVTAEASEDLVTWITVPSIWEGEVLHITDPQHGVPNQRFYRAKGEY